MTSQDPAHSNSLLRGTSIVAVLTLLSRLFGFARDLLTAKLFGAQHLADAYFVAYRIPNLLRSFVAEGALTSAFVPVFSTELAKGKQAAQAALDAVATMLFVATLLLSVLGIYFAPQIVLLIAPGFSADNHKFELCVSLTRIMFPFIIFISFVSLLNGALNSIKVFGTAAIAQVLINFCLIIGALLALGREDITAAYYLSISVLVGGVVAVVCQIPSLRKAGFHLNFRLLFWSPVTRQILLLMIPAVIGASVYQCSIFLSTVLASLLPHGSVSWLYYADRLTQLPIGVFSMALGSVLLPTLAHATVAKNSDEFAKRLTDSLRYTSFIIVPIAVGLIVMAKPLVSLAFERGVFSEYDSAMTARAVQCLSLGLWAVSCQSLIARAFIARKDALTPTLVGALNLLMNFFLSLILIGPISETDKGITASLVADCHHFLQSVFPQQFARLELGHAGLTLASSLSSWVSFGIIAILLSTRINCINWRIFLTASFKTLISASLAGGILVAVQQNTRLDFYQVALSQVAIYQVIFGSLIFSVLFIFFSKLLKTAELEETFSKISRLVNKGKKSSRA